MGLQWDKQHMPPNRSTKGYKCKFGSSFEVSEAFLLYLFAGSKLVRFLRCEIWQQLQNQQVHLPLTQCFPSNYSLNLEGPSVYSCLVFIVPVMTATCFRWRSKLCGLESHMAMRKWQRNPSGLKVARSLRSVVSWENWGAECCVSTLCGRHSSGKAGGGNIWADQHVNTLHKH